MPRTNLFKPLSTTSQDAHLQEAVIGCRGSRTHTRHTAVECTHPNWQTNSSASAYSKFPSYRPHWLQCNLPSVPPWRPCYLSKVELSSVHFLEFPGVFQRLPVPTLTWILEIPSPKDSITAHLLDLPPAPWGVLCCCIGTLNPGHISQLGLWRHMYGEWVQQKWMTKRRQFHFMKKHKI